MTLSYLVHLANYSDGILYVLAFLFVLTMAVMFDRFWFIRRTILGGSRMVERARACTTLDRNTLADLHTQAGSLPEAPLFAAALQHAGQVHNDELAAQLDEVIMLVAPTLDRRLWVLDTAVTLAPLLGLFGTIIGMFHAFSVLALPGHAATDVTAGVADALVATACGIFIAMIGLAGYNALTNQVRVIVHQLDSVKLIVVNRVTARG